MRRLVVLLTLITGVATSAQELPSGPGHDEVITRCITCHETDLIAQQRLSTKGWEREVDKMVRWGAAVDAAERDAMIAYLARHFSPMPAGEQGAPGGGIERTYRRACLVCHEADMIEAQRLGRPAWTREVEKMIRWGTVVSNSEKAALIDYLANRFQSHD